MTDFEFDESSVFGTICELYPKKVSVLVKKEEDFIKARNGRLVTIELPGASAIWLITTIENVSQCSAKHGGGIIVSLFLMGSYHWSAIEGKFVFTRSLLKMPGIEDNCFILQGKNLETFLAVSRNVEGDFESIRKEQMKLLGEQ